MPVLAAGAVSADDLLRFWVALGLLLVTARALGLLARRAGQPAVVGELLAGLILGPTVLGRVAPAAGEWLFPSEGVVASMISAVAWLGVALLLAVTGFEADLGLLRRLGRAAMSTSVGSLVIPLLLGLGLGLVLPETFRGDSGGAAFPLFMGVALGISALPVVAKVLRELDLVRQPIGQLTLAAGMVNDVVGWLLLGMVAGMAGSGTLDLGRLVLSAAGALVFGGVLLTVGQRVVDRLLRTAAQQDNSGASMVGTAGVVILVAGAVSQVIGIEAVLGAFLAGIVLRRSPLGGQRVERPLAAVADGILAPIFFATAGLAVDLGLIVRPEVALWTLVVVGVATVGKLLGGYLGARLGGLSNVEGLAIGIGLNARGALEIVVATVGLNLEVLSATSYTVVVIMAVATSLMTPPLLGLVLRHAPSTAEDVSTRRAALLASSAVLGARSVLLPTRGGTSSVLAGRLVDLLLPAGSNLVALTVHPRGQPAEAGRLAARDVQARVHRRMVWRERTAPDPASAIVAEAALGHDLLVVGASGDPVGGPVSGPIVRILSAGATPVLLLHQGEAGDHDADDLGLRRIMVATDGTRANEAARDVAAALALAAGAELDIVHILSSPQERPARGGAAQATTLSPYTQGQELVLAAAERAGLIGVEPQVHLRRADSVAAELVIAAEELSADLVVVSAEPRPAGGPLLGQTVQHLLAATPTTVLVVMPAGAARH